MKPIDKETKRKKLTRRDFIKITGASAGVLLTSASTYFADTTKRLDVTPRYATPMSSLRSYIDMETKPG